MLLAEWTRVWMLLVTFSNTDTVDINTFPTHEACEAQLTRVQAAVQDHPDVKSVQCVEGSQKS